MASKKEKRLQRQQLKLDDHQKKSIRTKNILLSEKEPKQAEFVKTSKKELHVAPHIERQQLEEQAKAVPTSVLKTSRFSNKVTWCISKADRLDHWSWGESRAWNTTEWNSEIEPKFIDFSKLTWKEIDSFSSDTGHKMHHGHELTDLHEEAQERWLLELDLDEFSDNIFRFRLGNTQRAWGYVLQAHFFLVWYERKHIIYTVD